MKKNDILIFIGAILLMIVITWGLYQFIMSLPELFRENQALASVLTTLLVVVVAPVIVKYVDRYFERKNQLKLFFHEKKVTDCAEMILFVHDHNASDEFKKELGIKTLSESEIQKCIHKFTSAVIQWGSPEMIQAWNEYRKNNKPTPKDGVKNLAKLLIAVRKEMGHESISEDDLLRFLVKDWDEHQEKQKQEEVNNAERDNKPNYS